MSFKCLRKKRRSVDVKRKTKIKGQGRDRKRLKKREIEEKITKVTDFAIKISPNEYIKINEKVLKTKY